MHAQAQWPFPQADYPSQRLCCVQRKGERSGELKKGEGGLCSSNQCCPLCRLTFEGLVICNCRLLYLNVSPQLPGTPDRRRTCDGPGRYGHLPGRAGAVTLQWGLSSLSRGKRMCPCSFWLENQPKRKPNPRQKPPHTCKAAKPRRRWLGSLEGATMGREACASAFRLDGLLSGFLPWAGRELSGAQAALSPLCSPRCEAPRSTELEGWVGGRL